MKKVLLALSFLVGFGLQSMLAQTKTITGTVTDANDGSPIPGVSVIVTGTTIGTVTRVDGTYSLAVPEGAENLMFSFVGMKTQEVAIAGQTSINIALESDAVDVGEVLVVAYGTAKKSSFTGSATTVDSKKLEKRTVSSITKALEGTVAGIQTTSGGGQPGSGAAIRIRGVGSINASSTPLYVVDGMPYDGNINAINPSDIENVSVLKDASASALYGARGANGVIIITTKKGSKSGEPVIQFKTTIGTSERAYPTYNTVSAAEFMELSYEARRNELQYDQGYSREEAGHYALIGDSDLKIDSYMEVLGGEYYNPYNKPSALLINPETGKLDPNAVLKYQDNWMDEVTRDNPLRQEYQLSMRGGNERTTYLMSLGYLDEKGLVENSKFKRYSGRVNVDSQLKSWLKAGINGSYSNTAQNYLTNSGTSYNNVWFSTLSMGPIYPVYLRDDQGDFLLDENGNKQFDYGESRPYNPNYNAVAVLYDDSRRVGYDNLSTRMYAELKGKEEGITKGLKLTLKYGFDLRHGDRLIYNNPYHGDGAGVGGRGYKYSTRMFSNTSNQLLTWNRKFGDHGIDFLVGHEYYKYTYSNHYGEAHGFPFEGMYELGVAAVTKEVSTYSDNYAIESYLSRINYDFADKYYVSASFRTDGSSRFYKDNRWGQFWSLGASWRISQESFMSSVNWLTNLTFKASYGEQGNDALMSGSSPNYYAWQTFYDLGYPNNTMGGGWLSSLENKDLKWEKNQNFNVGFESRLFDRASLSFEYYNKLTSDLLLYQPLGTSSGFNGFWANVGNMVNKGIDVEFSVDMLKGPFTWILGGQISHLKNEVTKLSTEGQEIVSGSRITKVGEPIDSYYLSKFAGVDPETGKQLYWKTVTEVDDQGNEIEKEVITDSYNEAAANRYIMGSRIPDFYGSFNNDFSYKGIDLSILCTYSVGGKVLDGVYNSLFSARSAGRNWHSKILDRWQNPGDVTDVPKVEYGYLTQTTQRALIDASYFSIKNVTLGYNLPKRILQNSGIDNLKLFVTADNLAMFNHLDGMDPQYNFSGGQNYSYVPVRVISLGIDVQF